MRQTGLKEKEKMSGAGSEKKRSRKWIFVWNVNRRKDRRGG